MHKMQLLSKRLIILSRRDKIITITKIIYNKNYNKLEKNFLK